jgi:thiol:disulfide interchange protein DsbD
MGAAIGFALVQPPLVTFAIFTALALGLATPYLALSFQPAWTRLLPKPGAWMEVLKQLTAVPLFATAIWLAYVYGRLYSAGTDPGEGVYKVSLLLGCFLTLAVAGWVLGKWPAKWSSAGVAGVLIVAALAIPLYQPKDTNLVWQPYSEQALDAARKSGTPVFIDFTAAWCLSCQVNEKLVLHASDVQRQLSDRHVTLLRADWTKYDPAITQELASLGRSGVPTYVLYPATQTAAPDVLPEVLTKDLVLDAIKRDTGAGDTAGH